MMRLSIGRGSLCSTTLAFQPGLSIIHPLADQTYASTDRRMSWSHISPIINVLACTLPRFWAFQMTQACIVHPHSTSHCLAAQITRKHGWKVSYRVLTLILRISLWCVVMSPWFQALKLIIWGHSYVLWYFSTPQAFKNYLGINNLVILDNFILWHTIILR